MAVAAALALSACGSDNNSSSSSTTSAAASGSAASSCPSGTLNSAGSTAQANAISQFIKDYQTKCSGTTVNYNANGSGAGFTSFVQKQSDFAGSDYAMSTTQAAQVKSSGRCGSGEAIDIPAVGGAIAVIYNIPGVTASINLDAKTLAGIFDGTITNWNNAAIAKDNPGVTFPSLAIQPFFRSDASGTSYNFSNYLNHLGGFAAANKQWPGKAGQGAKGSAGVAAKVKSTSGGIAYDEYSYASQNNLTYAKVSNAAGDYVQLSSANAAQFIAQAQVEQTGADTHVVFNYNYSNADAYPAVLVTYEIVCGTGNDSSKLPLIKGFLGYALSSTAQSELTNLGYIPLPSNVASADVKAVDSLS
ncbi:phosphate ABC transporter substrate-binding protein PstS [Actinospica sp. MGRD01-02]|uniref:Phosphate-binding protein n=1 Tax=Actinospica acidithermotolerans TaxID=2828514 RepID=A0A941E8V3_9ACTN|nr:phosphate ABC transporter substrate-binding protein PstS [Actinospica acidithermotolerans]